ncbi:MAG: DEAD/DEAH box helicase [Erysipelotrichaceae bacterium]
MSQFRDYNFKEETNKFIELNKFIEPTPIQQAVMPLVLKGKDIIGISDTGTGKTHAFLIPIMELLDANIKKVQVVITAPTRELATQLFERAKDISKINPAIKIRLVTGGTEKTKMNGSLKEQPQLVIGTPGRIKDLFLNDKTLRIDTASLLVVDEADMTLEFGFLEDVDAIAGNMNNNLQMLSFSATIPQQLRLFLKKYMNAPQTVKIDEEHASNPKIEHILIPCKHKSYEDKLLEILPTIKPYVCLIFANTRVLAASAAEKMREAGYSLVEIHGDLEPRARRQAMKNIMSLKVSYVVATDIAARGIDIDGVSHVISLGFPNELDFYIHRSGRTGRAGKDGICLALYNKSDENAIQQLKTKGIGFKHKNFKNGEWVEMLPFGTKKPRRDDPLEKEIAKIVSNKKVKVKPGYKVRRKNEIETLKRKAKRTLIQNDIKTQKKERAKKLQREKRIEE